MNKETLEQLKKLPASKFNSTTVSLIGISKEIAMALAFFKPMLLWVLDEADTTEITDGDIFRALMEEQPIEISMEHWAYEAERIITKMESHFKEMGIVWSPEK